MSTHSTLILLIISIHCLHCATGNQGNLTACILGPPVSAPVSAPASTIVQQVASTDASSDGNRSNSFWQRPGASGTAFRRTGDSPVVTTVSYDEQRQIPVTRDGGRAKNIPQTPVYDRSGFRREPLHPSFADARKQSPRNDGLPRTAGGVPTSRDTVTQSPWNRFATSPPTHSNTVPTFTPFDAITPDVDYAPSTSFFDPTRRPKDLQASVTTPIPPVVTRGVPAPNSGVGKARSNTPSTPGLSREVPSKASTAPSKTGPTGRKISNLDPSATGGVNSNDPDYQKVPEYAYVKQPISKVLDEPDLELEGKSVKFSIMKDALDRVGLLELASGVGPVTIFCPTDDAFMALPDDELIKLQQNPLHLRNTMLRHIVNFDVPPESLKNNMIIPSYSGEPLVINVVAGGKLMLVRGTPIIAATNAQNGVIYVISKVMAEETKSTNLLDQLERESDVSIFSGYIKRSAWLRKLQGQGPFTVFAPNNTAFEKLSLASRQVLDYNPAALERLLSYHVIAGAVYKKELETLDSLPPKDDRREPLRLQTLPDGSININDAGSIEKGDITTGNGVVHVIDGVLLPSDLATTFRRIEARTFFARQPSFNSPPQGVQGDEAVVTTRPTFGFTRTRGNERPGNAVERSAGLAIPTSQGRSGDIPEAVLAEAPVAAGNEPTGRFYRWLYRSGFLNVLNNTGNNYTVVLPIDKAINRLPLKYQQTLERDAKQLESLLMYHIVPGVVNMSRLRNEDVLPSVSGRDIRISTFNNSKNNESKIALSGATVTSDAKSANGKIRFLMTERVMYPPQGNLNDVITRSPILKTMASLVKIAQLEAGLSDVGPFTLFAPSDDAFASLPPESLQFLMRDPKSARAFLLRHIVRPLVFTSSVPIGNSSLVESTTGERVEIFRERDLVKVDGVAIKYADITATNGVVHVIDHVL